MKPSLVIGMLVAGFLLCAQSAGAGEIKRVTVEVKYADGKAVERMLRPFASRNGTLTWVEEIRTLTLIDEPGIVDVMLKMIQQVDVRPPQLQIVLRLVVAEKSATPKPIPSEISAVAKQIGEVFSYNSFTVMDSAFLATEANRKSTLRVGGDQGYEAVLLPQPIAGTEAIRFEFHMFKKTQIATHIDKGAIWSDQTLVKTAVELKDGETAILGASKADGDDKALITIVTLKIKK